ncbi:uncharacterized protein DEA37_0012030 [Paragonimus westermani]|uniref:SCP domain-containing protein n=1 Tax=Paragonimus westermani TaxID=34504 RepID=A0A5J4NMI9_9TREM|nr:uncharacterized protein DEA37_0012030 [Paragonimus westermani]
MDTTCNRQNQDLPQSVCGLTSTNTMTSIRVSAAKECADITLNESVYSYYPQMVWAKTTHVGCGVRDCNGVGSFPYGLSIVCNYGPG